GEPSPFGRKEGLGTSSACVRFAHRFAGSGRAPLLPCLGTSSEGRRGGLKRTLGTLRVPSELTHLTGLASFCWARFAVPSWRTLANPKCTGRGGVRLPRGGTAICSWFENQPL